MPDRVLRSHPPLVLIASSQEWHARSLESILGPHGYAVVRAYTGKQAFTYFAGVSSSNCGACGICMHLLTIPPLGRAKAHLHEKHETAIYVLSGAGPIYRIEAA